MQKVILLQNKRIINILMVSGIILLLIIYFFHPGCLIKNIFKIPCPMCGITRGIISFLHLNFIESFKYNLLSIPIFIIILLFYVLYLISFIFKIDFVSCYYNYFVIHYKIIIYIFIINWVINIFKEGLC